MKNVRERTPGDWSISEISVAFVFQRMRISSIFTRKLFKKWLEKYRLFYSWEITQEVLLSYWTDSIFELMTWCIADYKASRDYYQALCLRVETIDGKAKDSNCLQLACQKIPGRREPLTAYQRLFSICKSATTQAEDKCPHLSSTKKCESVSLSIKYLWCKA